MVSFSSKSSLSLLGHFPTLILAIGILSGTNTVVSAQPGKGGKSHGSHQHGASQSFDKHMKHGMQNSVLGQAFFGGQYGPNFPMVVVPMQLGGIGTGGYGNWGSQWQDPYVGNAYYNPMFTDPYSAYGARVWDYGVTYNRPYVNPQYSYQGPNYQSFRPPMDGSVASDYPQPNAYPTILTMARARSAQQRAESAFRRGDYHLANGLARQVVTLDSDNGIAWLFSAHTSFAIGDYDTAAEDLRIAISLLPSDQLDYVVKNFRHFYGRNDYVIQMQQLDQFINDRPVQVSARMVRGHQWASLGHRDAAYQDISIALSKRSNDEALRRLLEWISSAIAVQQAIPQQPQVPQPGPAEPMRIDFSNPGDQSSTVPSQIEPQLPSTDTLPEPDEGSDLEKLDDFDLPTRK